MIRAVFLTAAGWFLLSGVASAAQSGVVTAATAVVHQYPNATSPEIAKLSKGTPVRLSSDLTRDMHRVYWYKIRLPDGEFGYIRVTDVKGEQVEHEMIQAGVTKAGPKIETRDTD